MARKVLFLLFFYCTILVSQVWGLGAPPSATIIHDFESLPPRMPLKMARWIRGVGIQPVGSSGIGEISYCGAKAPIPFNNAVLSWNLDIPNGSGALIQIRAKDNAGNATNWYEIARYGYCPAANGLKSDSFGYVDVDTLLLKRLFTVVEYRVVLYSQPFKYPGLKPTLRLMAACCADTTKEVSYTPADGTGKWISLRVPWRSQYWEDPSISGRICGPTSLSMALDYFGIDLPTEQVASEAYDTLNGIYGNWPFLAQAAAAHQLRSYLFRCTDFEPIKAELAAGHPVILSVAWHEGDLTNAPIPKSNGHLILCVGMTPDGDLICNDPAGSSNQWDHVVYNKVEMGSVWLDRGGVAITVSPREYHHFWCNIW